MDNITPRETQRTHSARSEQGSNDGTAGSTSIDLTSLTAQQYLDFRADEAEKRGLPWARYLRVDLSAHPFFDANASVAENCAIFEREALRRLPASQDWTEHKWHKNNLDLDTADWPNNIPFDARPKTDQVLDADTGLPPYGSDRCLTCLECSGSSRECYHRAADKEQGKCSTCQGGKGITECLVERGELEPRQRFKRDEAGNIMKDKAGNNIYARRAERRACYFQLPEFFVDRLFLAKLFAGGTFISSKTKEVPALLDRASRDGYRGIQPADLDSRFRVATQQQDAIAREGSVNVEGQEQKPSISIDPMLGTVPDSFVQALAENDLEHYQTLVTRIVPAEMPPRSIEDLHEALQAQAALNVLGLSRATGELSMKTSIDFYRHEYTRLHDLAQDHDLLLPGVCRPLHDDEKRAMMQRAREAPPEVRKGIQIVLHLAGHDIERADAELRGDQLPDYQWWQMEYVVMSHEAARSG